MKAIISRLVVVAALVVLPMSAFAGNAPRPGAPAGKPGMQAPGAPGVNKPRPAAKKKPSCCKKQVRRAPLRKPCSACKLVSRSLLRRAW